MYLLAALHREHGNALGIDGGDQGSLMSWPERFSPDFMVMTMPSKTVHRHIEDMIGNYANVVGDASRTPTAGNFDPLQPATHDLHQLGRRWP